MYTVINTNNGHRIEATLEDAARITGLDQFEILWAVEEFGEAETDEHYIRVTDNDFYY